MPIYSRPVEFPRRFPGVHRFGNRCRAPAGWYAAALSSPALCKPCVYTSVASVSPFTRNIELGRIPRSCIFFLGKLHAQRLASALPTSHRIFTGWNSSYRQGHCILTGLPCCRYALKIFAPPFDLPAILCIHKRAHAASCVAKNRLQLAQLQLSGHNGAWYLRGSVFFLNF